MLALAVSVACGGRSSVGVLADEMPGGGALGGVGAVGSGGGSAARGGSLGATGGASSGGFSGTTGGVSGTSGGAGGTSGLGARGGDAGRGGSVVIGGTSGRGTAGSGGTKPTPGNDTTLRSLKVDEGYLMPSFDPSVPWYTVTIPRGSEYATVEAVPNDDDATVTLDGVAAEGPVELELPSVGVRLVSVVVTAPNGSSQQTSLLIASELVESSTYFKASNTEPFDLFGVSVAVSGDTLAVGAYEEDGGIPGDPLDASASAAGAVYVFVKDAGAWRQEAYLKPVEPDAFDEFGFSIALEGDTLVVGSPGEDGAEGGVNGDETSNDTEQSGAAYVFVRTAGSWVQQAYLKPQAPQAAEFFGSGVAIDGDTVVVGAPDHRVPHPEDAGAETNAGRVTVFLRSGDAWAQQAALEASRPSTNSRFGLDVAISGDTVVVGAYGEASDAAGVNGEETGTGLGGSGAAYVFVHTGSEWQQQAFLKASDPAAGAHFGLSVAIAGELAVVGAPWHWGAIGAPEAGPAGAGAAYLFVRESDTWRERRILRAANPGEDHRFGARVAIDDGLIAVSAPGETGSSSGVNGDPARGGAYSAGAVYVFAYGKGVWYQAEYVKASRSDPNDAFGISVALADGKLAVGAYGEASSAIGVNGDELDDSAQSSGAAYVLELAP